jgi:hypothetical protein
MKKPIHIFLKIKLIFQRLLLVIIGIVFFSGCFVKKNTTESNTNIEDKSLPLVQDTISIKKDSTAIAPIKEKLINDRPATAYGCPAHEKINVTIPENE